MNNETSRAEQRSEHDMTGQAKGEMGPGAGSRDRAIGALVGLAAGDAVGTTLEFLLPGSFEPINDLVGGGPFGLRAGQWTDDTSMAMCLAESLLDSGTLDPADQLRRYVAWRDDGYWSSTGRCFDIGGTTSRALSRFVRDGSTPPGPHRPARGRQRIAHALGARTDPLVE